MKSVFVGGTSRRLNVRKQWRAVIEDVFSAGRWLASAPLHEAGKTTGSGDTLKTGIRREELGFASNNLSSDPNAYPLISTFSKPHSEVASTTHLPALKGFRKGAPLFSGLAQDGRSPTNPDFTSYPFRRRRLPVLPVRVL